MATHAVRTPSCSSTTTTTSLGLSKNVAVARRGRHWPSPDIASLARALRRPTDLIPAGCIFFAAHTPETAGPALRQPPRPRRLVPRLQLFSVSATRDALCVLHIGIQTHSFTGYRLPLHSALSYAHPAHASHHKPQSRASSSPSNVYFPPAPPPLSSPRSGPTGVPLCASCTIQLPPQASRCSLPIYVLAH
ncbi:hypothetical protein HYPSUDRAFT_200275 [Hypholoma sublateritium FD-334 SS-4]|uniref:Uncharacterized protein n=1 Tax=Hypholoma sublateritium (strain FD-334 SS-4) TaxID=945553 RepID=A0A0D2LBZ1_HYPSF|nr:hypothetical protein HYPSUDRAFT_200275 [Hypholoma sublateritium FD-334 SS-4]